jgi:GNAT superfamily N-acetyltransferase
MTTYRTAREPELDQILGWAANEGWNPGIDDAPAFYATDPNGFFVATDDTDEPIAAISVVNHTAEFAFLGLYIVRPEHRGTGVGYGLWQHALKHAGQRTIGLDGVEAQQANYHSSGFVSAGGTTRFTGMINGPVSNNAQPAQPGDVPRLIALEAAASGVAKPTYLSGWFETKPTRQTITLKDQHQIIAFATVRSCVDGAKIGPLYAPDLVYARKLILHCATVFDGPISIDVPATSDGLSRLCDDLGLEAGFRTARMYRGAFETPPPCVFAVTSLELG